MIDLRQLPSIVPSDVRNQTSQAIELEFTRRVEKLKAIISSESVDIETQGLSLWQIINRCH
jgi:hypothetical protein